MVNWGVDSDHKFGCKYACLAIRARFGDSVGAWARPSRQISKGRAESSSSLPAAAGRQLGSSWASQGKPQVEWGPKDEVIKVILRNEGEADLGILTRDWDQSSKPRSQALLPKGGPQVSFCISVSKWPVCPAMEIEMETVVVIYWFCLQHSFLLLWQWFLDLSLQEHPLLHWLHSMWTSRSSTPPSMGSAWDPSWAILTIWILVSGAKDWKQKQHLEKNCSLVPAI